MLSSIRHVKLAAKNSNFLKITISFLVYLSLIFVHYMVRSDDKAIAALVHAPKRKKIKQEVNYLFKKGKEKAEGKGKRERYNMEASVCLSSI